MSTVKNTAYTKIRGVILLVAIVLLMCLAHSCTPRYAPVETVRRDTTYIKQMERDSIHERDSVIIYRDGDTVYHTRTHTVYRDRIRRDTVYFSKVDTLTHVVEVERELSSWQKTKMSVGGYAIVCAVMLASIWFAKRLKGL